MLASMKQAAVVYRVLDKLIIGSLARTSMGVGLEVDPRSLEMISPDEDVALVIGEALAGSGEVVPHPTQDQWKGMFRPFTQAAGVRSYKAFMADATSVEIKRSDGLLELVPYRNRGSKDGFEPILTDAVGLPADDLIGAVSVLKSLLDRNGS
jgi:hypothetical protein